MRKLLIHSNNTSFNTEALFPVKNQYLFDIAYDKNADEYIDDILNGDLGERLKYTDIVYIKLSLSSNYLEYLGLRLIYHIRLTKSLGDSCKLPIVLIADESMQFLGLTAEEPSVLFTKGVYLIRESYDDYIKSIENFEKNRIKPLDNHSDFVDEIRISPPSNYDSHHSIANEWALVRYFGMLKRDTQHEKYNSLKKKIEGLDYIKTLHFKYTESQTHRQKFGKKHLYTPVIDDVKNQTIGVIEDELNKGWFEYYDYLFELSGANLLAFDTFNKEETKEELVDRLKSWCDIKMEGEDPVDIFIVDIRLHDEDFFEKDFDQLSGVNIIKYIKAKNPGTQIVVHTASNKVWNFQNVLEYGVSSYCIKESPENFNTRAETKLSINLFCKELSLATSKSYLAKLFRRVKNIKANHIFKTDDSKEEFNQKVFSKNGLLDQIFNLLIISDEEAILNQSLLLCFQILEMYCGCVGDFQKSGTTLNSGSVWLRDKAKKQIFYVDKVTNKISTHFELILGNLEFQIDKARKTPVSIELFDSMELKSKFQSGIDATTLVEIISVLHYRDNISKRIIEKIMALRYYRSNVAAHNTGNIRSDHKIDSSDILFFFDIFESAFLDQV